MGNENQSKKDRKKKFMAISIIVIFFISGIATALLMPSYESNVNEIDCGCLSGEEITVYGSRNCNVCKRLIDDLKMCEKKPILNIYYGEENPELFQELNITDIPVIVVGKRHTIGYESIELLIGICKEML